MKLYQKNYLLSILNMGSSSLMLSLLFMSVILLPTLICSTQFQVGGDLGWVQPGEGKFDMYNQWAADNRFRVGDTIFFKYKKDSVLLVDRVDYENCVDANPIVKFTDGHTAFEFEQFGFHYFISGKPGHCTAGQKMVVRVLVQSNVQTPKSSHEADGWVADDFGPPGFNASIRLSVASCSMTAIIAMFIVLYLSMY